MPIILLAPLIFVGIMVSIFAIVEGEFKCLMWASISTLLLSIWLIISANQPFEVVREEFFDIIRVDDIQVIRINDSLMNVTKHFGRILDIDNTKIRAVSHCSFRLGIWYPLGIRHGFSDFEILDK